MAATTIVHIITGLRTGGAERMLVKLLQTRSRDRFTHRVISLTDRGTQGPIIESLGVEVSALHMEVGRYNPARLWQLRKSLRGGQRTILHGWLYHGAIAALLAGSGHPTIVGIRNTLGHGEQREVRRSVTLASLRLLVQRSARVVYCSRASKEQHERIGFPADRGMVIPNGFDTDAFRPDGDMRNWQRAEIGVPSSALLVGHMARYHPMKDHKTLLQAMSRVIAELPDSRLLLAGPGVDSGNRELCCMIRDFGLEGHVQLLGERRDMASIINACDVIAVTSAWGEGFPNVLGEAMACGVPCVATDVGDSKWIIGNTGRIIPPKAPEALARALVELGTLAGPDRADLGVRARRRVVDNFGLRAVAMAYEKLYEDVAASSW